MATFLRHPPRSLTLCALGVFALFGCSSDLGPGLAEGSGGAPGSSGAAAGSGGAASSGGAATGSGGSGGAVPAGTGGSSSGGVVGSGGTAGSGGSAAGGSAASGGNGSGGGGPLVDVTVFIAGDSTVANYADTASTTDQAGWGQMLPEILSEQVTVDNRAAGGRTALWFHLEGKLAGIFADAQAGDYLFVQFGTNDSHQTATFEVDGTTYQRYAAAGTTFKQHLLDYYIVPARAASVAIVLVTPPPRNSAYCGAGNSLGAYAQAMRELAAAEDVPVLDLNQKTFDHLAALCPAPTPEDFFAFRTDGTVDGTHFQENGARHMAGFLGEAMGESGLGLAAYLLP